MGGKSTQCMDLGLYGNLLMEQSYARGTVDDSATQRALTLEAGNDHVAFRAPEVVLEVMENTPARTHAAAGDNDCAVGGAVDRHGLFGARRGAQDWQQIVQLVEVSSA